MSKLVIVERAGSDLARFIRTKGWIVILLFATVVVGAVILALIANQAISQRFVDYFKVAFGIGEDVANRYSMVFVFSMSALAYLILMTRGMNPTVGKVIRIENGEKVEKTEIIGEWDFSLLGGAIFMIEIVALGIMIYENYNAVDNAVDIEKKKTMSNYVIGILIMFQILLAIMLRTSMNMVKTAEDTASKNIETESALAHDLASQNAKAALQGEQKPNEKAQTPAPKVQTKTVNLGGTDFEIKKSKVA